jgi:hypothetical protein
MKYFLLIFGFLPSICFSQTDNVSLNQKSMINHGYWESAGLKDTTMLMERFKNLTSDGWELDKIEFKDGSTVLDPNMKDQTQDFIKFRKTGVVTMYKLKDFGNGKYTMDEFSLKISKFVYSIEKLTPYQLVFTQQDPLKKDHELIRFSYLKTKDNYEEFLERRYLKPYRKISASGDTVYVFNPMIYPVFSLYPNPYGEMSFEQVHGNSYDFIRDNFKYPNKRNGWFRTSFMISEKGIVFDVKVTESNDSAYNDALIKAIYKTKNYWTRATLREKPVTVQFFYEFVMGKSQEEINYDDAWAAFTDGNEQYKATNWERALKLYNKSLKLNPNLVEARYKRADVYAKLNQPINACGDWSYLAGLGQKRAEKLFMDNCMK